MQWRFFLALLFTATLMVCYKSHPPMIDGGELIDVVVIKDNIADDSYEPTIDTIDIEDTIDTWIDQDATVCHPQREICGDGIDQDCDGVDQECYLMVADRCNDRDEVGLKVYSLDGEFIGYFGDPSIFDIPVILFELDDGHILVSDWGRGSIVELDERGLYIDEVYPTRSPQVRMMYQLPDGTILVGTDVCNCYISLYDRNFNLITERWNQGGCIDIAASVGRIKLLSDNLLLITSSHWAYSGEPDSILKFTLDGQYLGLFSDEHLTTWPNALEVLSNGDVMTFQYSGSANDPKGLIYDSDGVFKGYFAIGKEITDLVELPDGDIAAATDFDSVVERYAPDGSYLGIITDDPCRPISILVGYWEL